ncbi:LysR family transcriptional regulator [Photobacterium sp.]|uniref:LysR family transcriptional regulator n=1 Tax=Photobacterium sp. TaxID=660 RepID=UPI00299F33D5|nr:LysR family transcriptional regulator [Photobacterium sp.]MDX1304341.1 LysR family transcriptional regulator [Photobacterium sp.]
MNKINNLDIRLLRLFIIIVESGGFSSAQFKLNMHQSTISTKMGDLEIRLGMKLCQRGRGGFKLTAEGVKVYEVSKKLFEQMEMFNQQIDNIKNITRGNIKIALTDNLATNPTCRIQSAIRNFCSHHPHVNIETIVSDSYNIEMLLLDNKVDIGITSSEINKAGLEYSYLFNEHQSLYCLPSHPILLQGNIKIDDIASNPVVERGVSHNITPLSHRDDVVKTANTTNMEATAHLILSGHFIGYLPDHYAEIWSNRGEMVKIPAPEELEYYTDFYLTLNHKNTLTIAAKNLVKEIFNAHGLHSDNELESDAEAVN